MSEAMYQDSPPSVLVVSDHVVAGKALATYLERHGFRVVGCVGSAVSAAEATTRLHPDVALVDGEIGGGWRGVVAALDGAPERPRIAVLSSYWAHGERVEAARSGVGATMLKRIPGADLALQLRGLVA